MSFLKDFIKYPPFELPEARKEKRKKKGYKRSFKFGCDDGKSFIFVNNLIYRM